MKNFIYLLSFPVTVLLLFIYSDTYIVDADFEVRKELPLHSYCSEKDDYVKCVYDNNPALANFEDSVLREPGPDRKYAKDDKGGCDRDFLTGWKYSLESDDYKLRRKFVESCTPYIANAYKLSFGLAENLIDNDYNNELSATLYRAIDLSPSDKNISKESLQRFKEYIQNPYVVDVDGGKDGLVSFFYTDYFFPVPTFTWSGYVFSYWMVLLAFSQILISIAQYIKAYKNLRPILGKNTFDKKKKKRKYRTSVLISLLWAILWLITLSNLERTINPLDNSDAWWFYFFGLYPLVSILSSHFIITAED